MSNIAGTSAAEMVGSDPKTGIYQIVIYNYKLNDIFII